MLPHGYVKYSGNYSDDIKMDKFILLNEKEKRVYFEAAASEMNLMPQLVEKDFWVCWILSLLFSLSQSGSHLIFKGGTSLSKCYELISRFSEDIDISIEGGFLETDHSLEPAKEKSNKENKRILEELQDICRMKINEIILPELRHDIESALPDKAAWNLELDTEDPCGQTALFFFPCSIKATGNYVRSCVKIEFGARADHWPVKTMPVIPYVANISGKMQLDAASVRVLAAERTFWEKATILHMIYHYPSAKKMPLRMSRHYYDLVSMIGSAVYKKAMENISLLKNVAEHKALFFRAGWAHYEEAKPGSLRLVPREDQIGQLKADYRQMQPMFFEDPPSFEHIVNELRNIEKEINLIKRG